MRKLQLGAHGEWFNFGLNHFQKRRYCHMVFSLLSYPQQSTEAKQEETNMAMRIGEKIKKLRKARQISQESLANALGVTFQAVPKMPF